MFLVSWDVRDVEFFDDFLLFSVGAGFIGVVCVGSRFEGSLGFGNVSVK